MESGYHYSTYNFAGIIPHKAPIAVLYALFSVLLLPLRASAQDQGQESIERALVESGKLEDGKFNISISIRFDVLPAELSALEKLFQGASELLYDATDGQHQFGKITVYNNSSGRGNADILLHKDLDKEKPEGANSYVPRKCVEPNPGISIAGCSIMLSMFDVFILPRGAANTEADGRHVIVHEWGHYAYGILDEYKDKDGNRYVDNDQNEPFICVARDENGVYPHDGSLMENFWRRADGITEFCVEATHDKDDPGTDYNEANDTQQQALRSESSWETIERFYPSIRPQGFQGLPESGPTIGADDIVWEVIEPSTRIVLVIDSSGSMDDELSEGTKMEIARVGAQLFTNLAGDGASLGVVSFSSYATTHYPLTEMSPSTRVEARVAIERISVESSTNISDGLRRASGLITNAPGRASNPVIILLTDGEYNRGGNPLSFVVPELSRNGIVVHTIAIGEGNSEVLRDIAEQTGGRPLVANTSGEVQEAFLTLSIKGTENAGLVASIGSALPPFETVRHAVSIEETAEQATFVITWVGTGGADFILTSPSGTRITPSNAGGLNVEYGSTSHSRFYKVKSPVAGAWTMRSTSENTADSLQIALQASVVNPDVYFDVTPNKNSFTFPEEVVIRASLMAPVSIVGAEVSGIVSRPDGSSVLFTLYDDGQESHGDTVAEDGSYSNIFDIYKTDGAYIFDVTASSNRGFLYSGEGLFSYPLLGYIPTDGPSEIRAPTVSRVATFSINIGGVPEDYVPPPSSLPFVLRQNYPNPFTIHTTFLYQIIEETHVILRVYDMLGREVVILVNKEQLPGAHEVMWDGRNSAGQSVAGGVYLYQLTAGGLTTAKTIVRLK